MWVLPLSLNGGDFFSFFFLGPVICGNAFWALISAVQTAAVVSTGPRIGYDGNRGKGEFSAGVCVHTVLLPD